ncbi:hypothetical protein [Cryobacterium serini]|uniref:Uncharacterized protein n=1 Tax=Cryobacterium serini TaxID=1259201 RepID=A0A4R9BRZ6_9MICO|nr:hypothetical protein [Cryobacterium serini]TFD89901.1 hypothetical protein E3T51_04115 [Cryobacterium serini]
MGASLLTGCVQFATSARSLAVAEVESMLPYAESYFGEVLASFVDRDEALAAIRANETEFRTALLTAKTRDDVLRSDFDRTGVALYATGADGDQLYTEVLVSGRGATSDWTGQDYEIAYLCVRQLGTPAHPENAAIEQVTCPEHLITITFPGSRSRDVSLDEVRSK